MLGLGHPFAALAVVSSLWVVIALVGITGNALVILSAVLSERVRTTTNVLVVNLSVADLWTCLALPWTSVALVSRGRWPLATEVPCEIAAFMWHTGLGASLYNLALIAVNRAVRITQPLPTYNRLFSPCSMACLVTASWLVPVSVIAVPLWCGVGKLGHDLKFDTCTDEDHHETAGIYNRVQTTGFYPVPMVTVVVCYTVIYVHVRRHFGKQTRMSKTKISRSTDNLEASSTGAVSGTSVTSVSLEISQTTSGEGATGGKTGRGRRISSQQLQITKNLFYVVCAFTLCVSPYFISLFIPGSQHLALYLATVLICNSCVNPVIYAAKHPQFKTVMRPLMRCRLSDVPQPSRALVTILSRMQKQRE